MVLEQLTVTNVSLSLLVVVVAIILKNLLDKILIAPLEKKGEKRSVVVPLRRLISIIIYSVALLSILSIFSINLTAALAGLGVGAIVIGFGMQDLVTNWVSGIIIAAERTYKIDDVIKVGDVTGVVKDISLRSTKLTTYDKNDVIIPNSILLKDKVVNTTGGKSESVSSLTFSIDYTEDTKRVKKIIESVLRKSENVVINEKRKREIRFVVRVKEWTIELETLFWINDPKSEEFIRSKISESIKNEFEKAHILPPIPSFLRKNYLDRHKRKKIGL